MKKTSFQHIPGLVYIFPIPFSSFRASVQEVQTSSGKCAGSHSLKTCDENCMPPTYLLNVQ